MQFIEAKWLTEPLSDGAELPCLLGGAYLMRRDWFFQIGGTKLLAQWGSAEPHLSLKSWLAGGDCRLMKSVRVGHQFRDATNYKSKNAALLFNKIAIATTVFPEEAAKFIVDRLTAYYADNPTDLNIAKQMARAEQRHLECERAFNEQVFMHDLNWYLEKFGQKKFWA
jgi:hypothetical protein